MPSRHVHRQAGAVAGVAYAGYLAWDQPGPHMYAEAAGGLLGGIGGGLLPDCIDAPSCPRHRAEAHSVSITGVVGSVFNDQLPGWQGALRDNAHRYARLRAASPSLLPQIGYGLLEFFFHFLAGALAGLLAGYVSHLALDSLTPSSLPILC